MVGFDGRQIPNCGLLQTRLWKLRADEDRPRAFFHFKLSSPFPDSDHSTCVSTRSFPFFFIFFKFILYTFLLPYLVTNCMPIYNALYFCWYCKKIKFWKNWGFTGPAKIKSLCIDVYTFHTSSNFALLELRMLLYCWKKVFCQFFQRIGRFAEVDKKLLFRGRNEK